MCGHKEIYVWVVWIMGGAVCWRSKLQLVVALSSMEAEYVGATPAIQEVIWLRDLLYKLGITDKSLSTLHMDNWGAISLTCGAGDSNKMKHINIRYHFIKSHVECKCIEVQYLLTDKMTTDILTKNLGWMKHEYFVGKLGLISCLSGSLCDEQSWSAWVGVLDFGVTDYFCSFLILLYISLSDLFIKPSHDFTYLRHLFSSMSEVCLIFSTATCYN